MYIRGSMPVCFELDRSISFIITKYFLLIRYDHVQPKSESRFLPIEPITTAASSFESDFFNNQSYRTSNGNSAGKNRTNGIF